MGAHQTAERIIEQRRGPGAAGGGQPVAGAIAVGHAAIRGEIAPPAWPVPATPS